MLRFFLSNFFTFRLNAWKAQTRSLGKNSNKMRSNQMLNLLKRQLFRFLQVLSFFLVVSLSTRFNAFCWLGVYFTPFECSEDILYGHRPVSCSRFCKPCLVFESTVNVFRMLHSDFFGREGLKLLDSLIRTGR